MACTIVDYIHGALLQSLLAFLAQNVIDDIVRLLKRPRGPKTPVTEIVAELITPVATIPLSGNMAFSRLTLTPVACPPNF
jgi:hypothetical protein